MFSHGVWYRLPKMGALHPLTRPARGTCCKITHRVSGCGSREKDSYPQEAADWNREGVKLALLGMFLASTLKRVTCTLCVRKNKKPAP